MNRRDYLLLALLILIVNVPFLNKAFHVDDYEYLQIARQIVKEPLRPYDFTWVDGGKEKYEFDTHRSPPLFNYVLALGLIVFGESEIPLHGLTAIFSALVAGSFYALACRFSSRPLWATALMMLNPLFVPGHNVMLDVPMLGLGLAGLAFYISGIDRRKQLPVLVGGALVGLAIVTKYPAAIVVPLMVLYAYTRKSWLVVPAAIVALVPLAIWSVQSMLVHGRVHLLAQLSSDPAAGPQAVFERFLPAAAVLGSGIIPILAAPPLGLPRRWHWGILAASVVAAGTWRLLPFHPPSLPVRQTIHHFIFLSAGLQLLAVCLATGWLAARTRTADRQRCLDQLFLLAWLFVGLVVLLWAAPFICVRNLLWALPPAVLLLTSNLRASRLVDGWLCASTVLIGSVGLAVGWADMELANLQRTAARDVRRAIPSSAQTSYYSAQHGFAYYCSAAGLQPLRADISDLPMGTYIVSASSTEQRLSPESERRLAKATPVVRRGRIAVSTMGHGVNFYSTGTVDLPWELGPATEVYFQEWRVTDGFDPR